MIIRKERVADRVAVESLTRDAFWNVYRPGCIEHYILHILRDTKGFIPELSLVAVLEGEIVARIAYTYVSVEYENGERGYLCVLWPGERPSGSATKGNRTKAHRSLARMCSKRRP